jgi:hypothetical protein
MPSRDIDGRNEVGRVAGIEAAQLRALVERLAADDEESRVDLTMTDDGVLHARIAPPDRDKPVRWIAVTDHAEVIARIGPAGIEGVS